MRIRTGDLVYFTTSQLYDYLGNTLLSNQLGHVALILVGKELSDLSTCGPSPTERYCIYHREITPLEEVVGDIWFRPNGSKLSIIQRQDLREFTGQEARDAYLSVEAKCPSITSFFPIIKGYSKLNGLDARKTPHTNLCSEHMGAILQELQLVSSDAILSNLLPDDYYRGRFYQTVRYTSVPIFDKQTLTWTWLFTIPFIIYNAVTVSPMENSIVNQLLGSYSWPKSERSQKSIKKIKQHTNAVGTVV